MLIATGAALPRPPRSSGRGSLLGALAQIAATALMLAAMSDRSFVVVYAYIKTEPVQVALFGLIFLGDAVTLPMARGDPDRHHRRGRHGAQARHRGSTCGRRCSASPPARMFALSAIGYRGAILSLELPSYVMAATFTLVVGLVSSAVLLSLYLWLRDPTVLGAIARPWRPSLLAGFMGALASQFWFLAFALATAASVRTLALVEVLFAQAISRFVFKQATTPREALGIVLIVIGVAALLVGVLSEIDTVRAGNRRSCPAKPRPLCRDTSAQAPNGVLWVRRVARESSRLRSNA